MEPLPHLYFWDVQAHHTGCILHRLFGVHRTLELECKPHKGRNLLYPQSLEGVRHVVGAQWTLSFLTEWVLEMKGTAKLSLSRRARWANRGSGRWNHLPEFAQQVGGLAEAGTQINRTVPELPRISKSKPWLLNYILWRLAKKVRLGFPVTSYRKTLTKFLANPI